MSTAVNLLLAVLACTVINATAVAAAKRPREAWVYYHFDGIGFKAGPSSADKPFVAVREGARPLILLSQTSKIESTDLPKGAGAISGICYIQNSGGKLGSSSRGYAVCPHMSVVISSGGKQLVTVQTDEHGFFVVVLAAGTYSVATGPFSTGIPVAVGITSLVPLRAGKRMVD